MLVLMGFRNSINFTVAFSKRLFFFSHNKCHSLSGISEKVHIRAKFQKTEFDNYVTNGVVLLVLLLHEPNLTDG